MPGVVNNGPIDEHRSAPSTGTLRRSISLGQLIFFGLVFMGPAAVGNFGTLDAKSSGAVATVYIIATLVMAFTALSYMRMSRQIPRAGAVFAYAGAGIGPRAGYVSGWMILLDYLLIPSVAYMFTGIALNSLFPAIPIWLFVAVWTWPANGDCLEHWPRCLSGPECLCAASCSPHVETSSWPSGRPPAATAWKSSAPS